MLKEAATLPYGRKMYKLFLFQIYQQLIQHIH